MASPGMLLVISGPSGAGKTTIAHQIEKALQGVFSVSLTTRPKTDADTQGVDYDFVTREQFIQQRDTGKLLEWAEVYGNFYGTPKAPVEAALNSGRIMILEIDVEGAIQIKSKLPGAFALFVLPPSEETLLHRLRLRNRDDEPTIQKRFAKAKDEIARAKASNIYDAFITNSKIAQTTDDAVKLIRAQMAKK
jgi:guanylate kinase